MRTGFNMYAEYTQPQLTFLTLVPWFGVSSIRIIKHYYIINSGYTIDYRILNGIDTITRSTKIINLICRI